MKKAYFAAGCFWGVEYYFKKVPGVEQVLSGYMGGHIENPNYEIICSGLSGHFEVVEVSYDETVVGYEYLVKYFFEIHDFSQDNGQGPDIGSQYLSVIFYNNEDEKNISKNVILELERKGYFVATTLKKTEIFYKAEDYHQDYYERHNKVPYCHSYKKIF